MTQIQPTRRKVVKFFEGFIFVVLLAAVVGGAFVMFFYTIYAFGVLWAFLLWTFVFALIVGALVCAADGEDT